MHDVMVMSYSEFEIWPYGNLAIFISYLLHHLQWELETDHRFLN